MCEGAGGMCVHVCEDTGGRYVCVCEGVDSSVGKREPTV